MRFDGETILITGGTGFVGRALCEELIAYGNAKKVISFSRRWNDSEKLGEQLNHKSFRAINGSIKDYDALRSAMRGVDYVIHAAAYKSIVSAEYNPMECVGVNVDGTRNVIRAAVDTGVKKGIFISSDKAAGAITNLYGMTKSVGEFMWVASNNLGKTRFSVARYGNVLGSTGSVLPYFYGLVQSGRQILPVTDCEMTRFWFAKDQAVGFVLEALGQTDGGERFVPILKSSTMAEFAAAFAHATRKSLQIKEVGRRVGERDHEVLISADEMKRALKNDWCYIIPPEQRNWGGLTYPGLPADSSEPYTSKNADRYEHAELATLIQSTIALNSYFIY